MNNSQYKRNPYIIGTPIDDPHKFFGREDLFGFIDDNLTQGVQLILLYGQRRIGKSSVLKLIPHKIDINQDRFVFVNLDFQAGTKFTIHEIIHYIAIRIVESLELYNEINIPSVAELQQEIDIFNHIFLPKIYHQLDQKRLVLLLDEFDVLDEVTTESGNTEFFAFIRLILRTNNNLSIIPVVGRHLKELPNLLVLLRESPYKEISFLHQDGIERLITRPVQGVLLYEQDAITEIFRLSSGHPYFTQVICFALFNLARERNIWTINQEDVKGIVNTAIQIGEGGLAWFWDGLPIAAQVIFSAAAEAQRIAIDENQNFTEEPLNLLKKHQIIPTESLTEAARQLADYGFFDDTKRRVRIELVRRWLVKTHQLKYELNRLEEINQEDVNKLLSEVDNKPKQALQIYEQVLEVNPNNFKNVMSLAKEYLKVGNLDKAFELYRRAYKFYSISNIQINVFQFVLSLAEEYLQSENFDQALELYTRSYNIDPENTKNGLIKTLETYGHKLIIEKQLSRAKEQFQQVLQIDLKRESSQQKLREISTYESLNIFTPVTEPPQIPQDNRSQMNWSKVITKGSIAVASATLISVIGISVGGYQFFRICPEGQQRELGLFCKESSSASISQGDSIIFPINKNENSEKGIKAFKNQEYNKAADFFKKALNPNQKHPELLIYYNNALARKQGSPFTFAVVVPVDNKTTNAEEMLRGVAQAQDEFNKNQGFNGRFLEIVIANDDNNPAQAKQVAQALANHPSILGIIGHNSSDTTIAALSEYEKAGLAVISPTVSNILLGNPVFFRAVDSDEIAGKKLAEYTYKNLKLKRAVIFANPDSPYSNSIRETFTNHFEKLGGEVVRKPLIDLTSTTFNAKAEVARTVYNRGEQWAEAAMLFPDTKHTDIAINIAKEITSRNEKLKQNPQSGRIRELKMLGGVTLYNNETLDLGRKDVEGLIIVIPWFREISQAKLFVQKSKQQWGGDISWRTATSFDATQALIKTLSKNPTRATVLQGLKNVNLSSSETSGYPLQFTEDRERQSPSVLVQVKGGQFIQIDESR
jgi:ABC-type branched-subunit amino acid transport system substrate-binding protein